VIPLTAAAGIYNDLANPLKVLTDDEARKTWDEFGHPDGRQGIYDSMLGHCKKGLLIFYFFGFANQRIALPKYLVESKSNMMALFVKGSVFGILIPLLVAKIAVHFEKTVNQPRNYGNAVQGSEGSNAHQQLSGMVVDIAFLDVMFKADDLLYAVMYSKLEKAIWEWLGNFLPIFEIENPEWAKLIQADSPLLMKQIYSIVEGMKSAKAELIELQQRISSNSVPTSKGVSLLEIKLHGLLLTNLSHFSFFSNCRQSGQSTSELHPSDGRLIEMCVILGKIKPMEARA
ncbi:secretory subunit, partial [Chytriomyces hyalinus]